MTSTDYTFNFCDQFSRGISIMLDSKYNLKIQRHSDSTAHLYCCDENGQIVIPEGFKIINDSSNEFISPIQNNFILCWLDNYTVTYKENKIKLMNKHIWDVSVVKYDYPDDYPGSDSYFL
jgi:hypothetical protein